MPTVQLQGLAKSFSTPQGPIHAVRGIDLAIAEGETVALLGPNGAGKSTTIDMLLGLLEPDEGTAELLGGAPSEAIADGAVGAMLQTGALVPDTTARELVSMVAALYPRALSVDAALERSGASGFADQRTQKLSGGQAQRVRLAVALIGDPRLLVLDEPTVALDVEARRRFWDTMRGVADSGKTILFATHYLEEADAHADRVVLLARGAVVADAPPAQVRALVGTRTISATVPGAQAAALEALPGVERVDLHRDTARLSCSDSDTALRALLAGYPQAREIEVRGADLEEAFLELTADEAAVA